MWKSIPPQHSTCPSSLTSRACISHKTRPSTFSLAAFVHGDPPKRWLISHRDLFSEVCPCALSSLMRSASLPTAPGIPRSCGAEPLKRRLEEASTHDANGYQATSSDRCFLYVSSVSSTLGGFSVAGHLVSHDTPDST